MILYLVCSLTTAAVAYIVTCMMRAHAIRAALFDKPNERSLHSTMTPRGGGVGIAAAVGISALAWCLTGGLPNGLGEIVLLAIAISMIGFWDDRVSLTARFRLRAQLFIALILILVLQHAFDGIVWGVMLGFALPTILVSIFVLLFTLWMTNLFNFMDGSDGIAGTQSLTVALGFLGLSLIRLSVVNEVSAAQPAALFASILAGASFGFLLLNWQPAKIFMGDVGSVFLGFLFAALTIWMALGDVAPFAAILLLQGTFIIDATVTLLRRVLRGKKPHEAHRSHAYQRLVQSGWTHGRVAVLYGAINVLWLLPMSIVSANLFNGPRESWLILIAAWLPLVGLALWMRAGEDFTA